MNPPGLNINAVTNTKCLLFGVLFLRIRNGQLPLQDQMRRETFVRMWRVVGVPAAVSLADCGCGEVIFAKIGLVLTVRQSR